MTLNSAFTVTLRRYLHVILFCLSMVVGIALFYAAPVFAETEQEQTDAVIERMRQSVKENDQQAFASDQALLEEKNTPEAYLALGKLYHNFPTTYGLRILRYEEAAGYYRKAFLRGEALNQETKAVNEARVRLARLILQDRLSERDYDSAVQMLTRSIESGNPNAALVLAQWTERGVGLPKPDYEKAAYWYRFALRGDLGEAAIAIVSLYRRGYVKPPNEQSANDLASLGISLLTQRSRKGDSTATYRLGRIYGLGLGVKIDAEKAMHWYQEAAKLGSVAALRQLAVLASREENDPVKAAEYMVKAAEAGSTVAALEIGKKLTRSEGYYLAVTNDVAQTWIERAASVGNTSAIEILTDQLLAQGKAQEAVAYLEKAASKGSVDSYLTLYQLFKAGQGVSLDTVRARQYFMSAQTVRKLQASEKLRIGQMMLSPSEPVYSPQQGLALVNEAAEEGSVSAMSALANSYLKGTFTEKNNDKVLFWREKAADKGDIASILMLSEMYERGIIVKQDRKKANILLSKTLNNVAPDDAKAMMIIGKTYVEGRAVTTDMDAAGKWFERAIKAGNVEAMVELGRLAKWNSLKNYSPSQAVDLFKKASSRGSKSAFVELGILYGTGMLVPLDPAMAFEFYQQAAEGGSLEGMRQVGLAYKSGIGVTKDDKKGDDFLRKSALLGNGSAMLDLGNIAAMRGQQQEALKWWNQAAELEVPDAYYFLALAYRDGNGVERDASRAENYLKLAAKLDNYQAQLDLENAENGN